MTNELVTTELQQEQYSLDEAFDYCAQITEAHYENFPVASLFLPQEKRPYIQAIYAFSRTADDVADEFRFSKEERLVRLENWEQQLVQCYEGNASHPIFIALSDTVRRLGIPIEPLKDLLAAFKRDITQNRYETFDDLLSYCKCSANPVGRLVLMIFNQKDEKLFALSDHICTALQLTNFWQDAAIDRKKDRLYIPIEDMQKFEYRMDDWKEGTMNSRFRDMMKFEIKRTREMFYQGAELPSIVEKELQIELRLVWFGGMAILKKLDRIEYNVFHQRPALSNVDKFMIFVRAFFRNDLSRYGRKKKPWDLT
ncbi:MAG: squalene synthase HpnC [Ignavibacteriae bacterium]|nr:squalene synthase HpnC [Ignavibacteria bacterium]MBI3364810.1 squalene synthase HpnC [Ignavibacteriota bacterium]